MADAAAYKTYWDSYALVLQAEALGTGNAARLLAAAATALQSALAHASNA